METVRIYRLTGLRPRYRAWLRAAQMEAAPGLDAVPGMCTSPPGSSAPAGRGRMTFQRATRGRFALHSQTIQAIFRAFLGNVETTRELRKTNPKIRYPYKDKRFYPLLWPAQAVSWERGRIVLPMGRGTALARLSSGDAGAEWGRASWCGTTGMSCMSPWRLTPADASPGSAQATVDLGEIHQAAVTTDTGAALVVSGRGIRSLKRRHNRALGQIAKKRHRCLRGSRRDRRLQAARRKVSARKRRQVRDLRHKGTRAVIAFCQAARRWLAVHRQSAWSQESEERTASQSAHEPVGVRPRHRLSHL